VPPLRLVVPIGIAVVAALSLLVPFAPVYDPWAWLIWGRELVHLDLDTSVGPSWKPLPVIVTTALAPAGDASPELWLFLARVGWLASAALAWRLAARLVFPQRLATAIAARAATRRVRRGRLLAGAVAALGIVLLFDPFTAWVRQFAGGLSEPLLVALVLGAIDRELARRPGQGLALGAGAALIRPEAWPFLVAYAFLLWRRNPNLRGAVVAVAVAVPVLWVVPDLIGSGSPFTGAERARAGDEGPLIEALDALWRSFNLVLVGLWVCAGYAVYTAWRDREREIVVLAAGAVAWIGLVAALAIAGYPGLPRFVAPAGAIVCVLGAVGAVRAIAAVDGMRSANPRRPWALAATGAVIAAIALQAGVRAAAIPAVVDDALDFGRTAGELHDVTDRLDPNRLELCRAVTTSDFLTETALAWDLDRPLAGVSLRVESAPPSGIALLDADAPRAAAQAVRMAGTPLASTGGWSAYAISC
jgi:hypothetical protein